MLCSNKVYCIVLCCNVVFYYFLFNEHAYTKHGASSLSLDCITMGERTVVVTVWYVLQITAQGVGGGKQEQPVDKNVDEKQDKKHVVNDVGGVKTMARERERHCLQQPGQCECGRMCGRKQKADEKRLTNASGRIGSELLVLRVRRTCK